MERASRTVNELPWLDDEQAMLSALLEVMQSYEPLEETLSGIERTARRAAAADAVVVRVAVHGPASIVASTPILEPSRRMQIEHWLHEHIETAWKGSRPLVIHDATAHPQLARSAADLGVRSVALVPIVFRQRTVGLITAVSYAAGAFAPREVFALELLGDNVGPLVEHARLRRIADRLAA